MQEINLGSAANSGTGDPIREAFSKINANFNEVASTKENKQKTIYSITSTTPNINTTNGEIQVWVLLDNSVPTVTIGSGRSVTLHIETQGFTLTWPASINWVGGAPALNATGINIVMLWQVNSTIFGRYIGYADVT